MGKHVWGSKPRINFILKKPGNGRRTFQVLKRTIRPGEKPAHASISDARIDAVNASLVSGRQGLAECEFQVRAVMAELQAGVKRKTLGTVVQNEENRRALDQYWARHFAERTYEVESSQESIKHRLQRAVDAVGSLSLYAAPREKLQAALDKKYRDHRQRALAASLNGLLKFLGRDFELGLRPKRRRQPRHLKLADFERVQRNVQDPAERLLQRAAFGTGLRQGELFALGSDSIQGKHFFSELQMDRELNRRWTKTRDEERRRIYVLPGFERDVKDWCALPLKTKRAIRTRKHADLLKSACLNVFPDQPEKHCTFHDLRHSFAVHLATRGVPIGQIAKCLNESEQVCQEYYGGFYLQDDAIDAIDRIMRSKQD